jgi:hypothetical protein
MGSLLDSSIMSSCRWSTGSPWPRMMMSQKRVETSCHPDSTDASLFLFDMYFILVRHFSPCVVSRDYAWLGFITLSCLLSVFHVGNVPVFFFSQSELGGAGWPGRKIDKGKADLLSLGAPVSTTFFSQAAADCFIVSQRLWLLGWGRVMVGTMTGNWHRLPLTSTTSCFVPKLS